MRPRFLTCLCLFLCSKFCVSHMDWHITEESLSLNGWVHLAMTCLLPLFRVQKKSRCDLPNPWPAMSAPEVRREGRQVTRLCSLLLVLDSGSNVFARTMSKDVKPLPVFAPAISIHSMCCIMSAALRSQQCVQFGACRACTCKDYVRRHSQPKWHCHFGPRCVATEI